MNAKLGSLSFLALIFLAPLAAQAAPPPEAPIAIAPPLLSPAYQPPVVSAPIPEDMDTSSDQTAPGPESVFSPSAAVQAPSSPWIHYSMDDLAQNMQSLDAPAEAGHYTMDDIAQSGW